MTLEFTNLPLVEVAIRLSCFDVPDFDTEFVLRLRDGLKDLLPGFRAAPFIETAPSDKPGQFIISTMQPMLFEDTATGLTLTVQNSLLVFRWSATETGKPEYPRFEAFRNLVQRTLDVAFGGPPPPTGRYICNMGYSNFIPSEAGPFAKTMRPYLSDKLTFAFDEPHGQLLECNLSWQMDGMDIRLIVQRATRGETAGYGLTTVAGKVVAPSETPLESISKVHDRLQTVFIELLSVEAKQEWGYVHATGN